MSQMKQSLSCTDPNSALKAATAEKSWLSTPVVVDGLVDCVVGASYSCQSPRVEAITGCVHV